MLPKMSLSCDVFGSTSHPRLTGENKLDSVQLLVGCHSVIMLSRLRSQDEGYVYSCVFIPVNAYAYAKFAAAVMASHCNLLKLQMTPK
jgi:hypothetical protein